MTTLTDIRDEIRRAAYSAEGTVDIDAAAETFVARYGLVPTKTVDHVSVFALIRDHATLTLAKLAANPSQPIPIIGGRRTITEIPENYILHFVLKCTEDLGIPDDAPITFWGWPESNGTHLNEPGARDLPWLNINRQGWIFQVRPTGRTVALWVGGLVSWRHR